ncbi:hypothetical protein, partial [Pseudomonas sp. 30_B]|uniref:hypothetical protein n=1 Tax=Pseudomonas sp. 30_B TaxID=2813575 RepID=UPI001A9FBB15
EGGHGSILPRRNVAHQSRGDYIPLQTFTKGVRIRPTSFVTLPTAFPNGDAGEVVVGAPPRRVPTFTLD